MKYDWPVYKSTSSSGKFTVLDAFCFAEFSRYYYLPSNPKYKENDYQPEELDHEIVEDISNSDYLYPKDIKLLSNEKMKCHKTPYVLQYYLPNKEYLIGSYNKAALKVINQQKNSMRD